MVFCGDSASVGLFHFFHLFVSLGSELIIVSGVVIFLHTAERKVLGIVGGPEKTLEKLMAVLR